MSDIQRDVFLVNVAQRCTNLNVQTSHKVTLFYVGMCNRQYF